MVAERDNIQAILRRAGWTVQVAPLSATRYRMTAQREAPLEHRKRSANAVANLLRENGYSAGVVAVTAAGFDIDAKPIKASRAAKLSPLSQTTQRAERQRAEAVVSRLYNALQPIADRFGGRRQPTQRYSDKDISALANIANAYGATAKKQRELGNTALALALAQTSEAVQRAYMALANGNDLMGDRMLDSAIQQARQTLTVAKNGKAVTRSVVRAAKRAGLKVSDESPRVIAGAVRMRAREWQKEKPTFDHYDNAPGDMALVDRAVRAETYHWKRLIGTYPTLARVARQTLIDAYLSPGGLAKLWKRASDVSYIENFWRVVYSNLDTIAQYFEKQG